MKYYPALTVEYLLDDAALVSALWQKALERALSPDDIIRLLGDNAAAKILDTRTRASGGCVAFFARNPDQTIRFRYRDATPEDVVRALWRVAEAFPLSLSIGTKDWIVAPNLTSIIVLESQPPAIFPIALLPRVGELYDMAFAEE